MTNFHHKRTTDQGATYVNHQAKAPSAGSTQAGGSSRGPLRRALATRAARDGSNGISAPPSRRLRATLAILALAITVFAITASPASATQMGTISKVSYGSAKLTGTVTGIGFGPNWSFQYCTQECSEPTATWSPGPGGSIIGTGEIPVEKQIEGLKGATEYFIRLTGGTTDPAAPPYPSFTTLPVDPASVLATDNASEVSYTTAKASGEIERPANKDPAFNANCRFEYVTDAKFDLDGYKQASSVPCGIDPLTAQNEKKHVEVSLEGLAPATEYHLRLTATNAGPDASLEAAQTFTTLPVDPPSVVSIENAGEVEYTQAQVKGVVERPANADLAFDVECNFEYVTDQQFDDNEGNSEPGFTGAAVTPCNPNPVTAADTAPGTTKAVSATLTGLVPQTTYHLRLAVSNKGGADSEEAAASFTTLGPVPVPTVTATDEASEVKYNSAKFTGKVLRPAGADPVLNTNCHFEFISDAQFTANEGNGDPGFSGAEPVDCAENTITSEGQTTVSAKAGLLPETTYHFRLVAENVGGSDAEDATNTFTTPEADLPIVTIDPVEGGIFTTAHVTGTVTLTDGYADASETYLKVSSDGGATWSYTGMLFTPTFGPNQGKFRGSQVYGGEGLYIVQADLTGLQPSTTYLFRIASSYNVNCYTTNGCEGPEPVEARGEVRFSPVETITTEPPQPPPTAEDLEVTDVTATSAHFSGTVDPHAPAGPLSESGKKAFATHWEVVCVPECKDRFGNAIGGTVQGEEGPQAIAGDLERLEPGTEYTITLVAHSEGGDGTDTKTLPTLKLPPSVIQTPGGPDGKGGYVLEGIVNPNNETITDCKFEWGPDAPKYAFKADCSPLSIGGSKPVTVEAHLTGLNPDVDYHALLVVTYDGDKTAKGVDQKFKATLAAKQPCPANEQQRIESNSLALPECRAYEMVSPPGKEGFSAQLWDFYGGIRVRYASGAGNISRSGQNVVENQYVAARSATGWETIPNLNGSGGGTIGDAPSSFTAPHTEFPVPFFYSEDLLSSVWAGNKLDGPDGINFYLRKPDGLFTLIGPASLGQWEGSPNEYWAGASDDLSHVVLTSTTNEAPWGPGVYEFVGTGNEQPPRRVDVDNSGSPIATCGHSRGRTVSGDGRVIVVSVPGGCGAPNPPVSEIWARIGGTTSVNVAASQCTRLDCNAPSAPAFVAIAKDGSRAFFITTQQLVNGDTDQTNDVYACDLPSGAPAPTADKANPCAALRQVSGSGTEAKVEAPIYNKNDGGLVSIPGVVDVSEDGSTALIAAQGILADNKDALGEKAVAGDHNLYAWRTDAAHPNGQITFVGTVHDKCEVTGVPGEFACIPSAQSTPDGRYLVFTTAGRLLDTDTDDARDVYRYDADTEDLTRVSTNVFGVAGNGDFDAAIPPSAVSDDGQKIVFTTSEPLNLAVDGNEEPDAYLWTPDRVSLISAGSVGAGVAVERNSVAITPSGQDIYFQTPGALTPADGDDSVDVYDARVGGGFGFPEAEICTGEKCQPDPVPALPTPPSPANTPNGEGNVKPSKPCPKGKVRKKNGKCVKKPKKHSSKKHHGKKAGHKQGGGK